MTKEEFNEIIEPLHLLDEAHRRFLISALDKNFEEHQKQERILELATSLATKHDHDFNAEKCHKGLDNAYFSMHKTDFGYMLNALQNKVNIYREMIKK